MSSAVGGVVGVVLAIASAWWSRNIARDIDVMCRTSKCTGGAQILVGGFTGAIAAQDPSLDAAPLIIVAGLLVVQAPIDLALHRLARVPTVLATVMVAIVFIAAIVDRGGQLEFIVAVGAAVAVVVLFGVLQRISPRSLGWGDVLVVVPLALAVAFVSVSQLPVWLVIAATTAALHGVVLRLLRGEQMLPFGPHLLFAAWLVLLVSV